MSLIRVILKIKKSQLAKMNTKSLKIGHLFWFGHLQYTNLPDEVRVYLHMEARWWYEMPLSCIGLSRSWVTVQWNDHQNHINFLMIWDQLCRIVLQISPVHASAMISTSTNGLFGSIASLWTDGQQLFMDHDIYTIGGNRYICTVFGFPDTIYRQMRLWCVLVVVHDV